jgi:hypothetical protein
MTAAALLGMTLCLTACTNDNTPATGTQPLYDPNGAVLYNYPAEATPSDVYTVDINETPYFVFPVPQTNQRESGFLNPFNPHIVSFDIKGRVRLDITPRFFVKDLKIRPERAGMAHTIEGNTVTIFLNKPQSLSLEFNDDIENPLLVFANEPETEIPDRNDPNVRFYEAGKIHEVGYEINRPTIQSGQTVYIAPGAIVYGAFTTPSNRQSANIRIMGRGVLSGAKDLTASGGKWPLLFRHINNLTVEGVTLVDCKNWSMLLFGCDNVTVRGVKIVSNTGMDDGIDIVGCKNVTVDNCFIRTKDDCIALKAGIAYIDGANLGAGNIENITVKNSVIWNGKHGNGLEIGFELNTDTIKNVTFENIDLIHTENPGGMDEGAITIHNSGKAIVRDVLYKDIRIEDPQRMLFHFAVLESVYTSPANYGKIQNIRLEDIEVSSTRGALHSSITGRNSAENINYIMFKNLTINEKKINQISNTPSGDFYVNTNVYASDIEFE